MNEQTDHLKKDEENLVSNFHSFPIIGLGVIVTISFLIRSYLFSPDIPVTLDGLEYFLYAIETSSLGHLPNYSTYNNGWPYFLSLFFSIVKLDDAISLMQLQRSLTVVLSLITIIPVYLLCRKFFNVKLSLIGAAIFGFEPRIIQNSLFGLTEPLYILLGTLSILFFLNSNKKIIFLSYVFAALTTLIRSEGLFLFLALSIMFIIRFRKDRFVLPKFVLALGIFISTLMPMVIYRVSNQGNDAIVYRVVQGIERTQNGITAGVLVGIENFIKFLGWDLIPIFIFFVPLGIFLIFKNLNYKTLTIIITSVSLSLPALYAYSVPALDTRYFFMLYPMFCVISLFSIDKFEKRIKKKNLALILIFIGILSLSLIFINYKVDMEHEREAYIVSNEVITTPKVVNVFYPESRYLESSEIIKNWNDIRPYFSIEKEKNISTRQIIPHKITVIDTNEFDSLDDFLKSSKSKGLTHLIIDENDNRSLFLKSVFNNEKAFPFLIKEFDSSDIGLNYHVKIFKINYEEFELRK